MQPELIAIYVRGIVIILTTFAGIFCIYLGWRLYFESIRAQVRLEASVGENKLSLQSTAPGIFFATFGAALLIYVINAKVEFEEVQGHSPAKSTSTTDANKYSGWNDLSAPYSPPRLIFTQTPPTPTNEPTTTGTGCLYKSRKLKWFDDDDQRTERQQILETLAAARTNLLDQLSRGTSRAEDLRRHALVLEQLEVGFRP